MAPNLTKPIPLSLYIHLPWCVQKCPYCDFNSHAAKEALPEAEYVDALLTELDGHLPWLENHPLISIFFGGGTPSLFSSRMIAKILDGVAARLTLAPQIEITLEANPGTVEAGRFKAYYQAGINRLSLGIQSLQDDKLKTLGRIHNAKDAMRAIEMAQAAGFRRLNLDLMFGLPHQSIDDACADLEKALSFKTTHLSWYQLTIEPNTIFYKRTPPLPHDEIIEKIEQQGKMLIQAHGLQQYEVSAYAKAGDECLHNYNYWEFGDYIGIGAGAHSKLTLQNQYKIVRFVQVKLPHDYLNPNKRRTMSAAHQTILTDADLQFEFMLNALRLTKGIHIALFSERTGLSFQSMKPRLEIAKEKGLLLYDEKHLSPTPLGKKYLNDLVGLFG